MGILTATFKSSRIVAHSTAVSFCASTDPTSAVLTSAVFTSAVFTSAVLTSAVLTLAIFTSVVFTSADSKMAVLVIGSFKRSPQLVYKRNN